jgi:hypothetical protein
MALSCATPTSSNITGTSVSLATTGGAGGTGPYTYQWYQSTTSGFSAGPSNLVSGATGLTLNASNLLLGVEYYYKVIVTDTGNSNATATSSQLGVQLLTQASASPSQNAFAPTINLGALDQAINPNTQAVIFDPGASGTLVAGQAVVVSTTTSSIGTVPMVKPSTAAADVVLGFVAYDFKTAVYNPGDRLQIAAWGNVIYLTSLAAITQGTFLTSTPSGVTNGGVGVVTAITGSSGFPIIGYAHTSIAAGTYGRVFLNTPANPINVDGTPP